MRTTKKLWIGIGLLVLLSPAGLILPELFKAGAAWGEWSADEIAAMTGYVPGGLEKLSSLWRAPLPDYTLGGSEGNDLVRLSFSYILSAVIGIAATVIVTALIGRAVTGKENEKKE